jgi:hypothetical protein
MGGGSGLNSSKNGQLVLCCLDSLDQILQYVCRSTRSDAEFT